MYNKINILGGKMRRVKCPICMKPFMVVSDDIYISFDTREADQKAFCDNCKRKIRFSEKKRLPHRDSAE